MPLSTDKKGRAAPSAFHEVALQSGETTLTLPITVLLLDSPVVRPAYASLPAGGEVRVVPRQPAIR